MGFFTLVLMAIGLSMDACAVAICKGLSMEKVNLRKAVTVGLYFGGFQAAMPLAGYFLGKQFADLITSVDHWIAFVLLGLIGAKMIKESMGDEDCKTDEPCLSCKAMLPLSIATSIDALAVGISFAFLKVDIGPAVALIGAITFIISMAGVKVGNAFGIRFKSSAELVGGVILILMGLKILLEHTVLA
jgi:putative Mn2+ efflux pump MntP